MPVVRILPRALVGASVVLLLVLASIAVPASAAPKPPPLATGDVFSGPRQHGVMNGHLPGSSANVELIGELEPTVPFGPIAEGQIADLAIFKDVAYLNSWNEPTCTKGGFYVVDIRNPRNPQQLAFEPALEGRYHGEGAHVISVATKTFTGDLLAVNNEHGTCLEDRKSTRLN